MLGVREDSETQKIESLLLRSLYLVGENKTYS